MRNQIKGVRTFPADIREFNNEFPDEKACVEFLFNLRWPNGFRCPCCGWQNRHINASRSLNCPHCGNRTSLTTGTIMHGTKKKLADWLSAIWWLCINDGGSSAKELQRRLHISSYQTAWVWLQKIRMAMGAADTELCSNVVELGCCPVSPAWEKDRHGLVMAAVEVILPAGISGRIKMQHISECSRKSIKDFLGNSVKPGSVVIAPGLGPYKVINEEGYVYVVESESSNSVRIIDIIAGFEIWLNKLHRGGVTLKHLQLYTDEFCFRSNSAMLQDRAAIFNTLLSGVMKRRPTPYKKLVADKSKERRST